MYGVVTICVLMISVFPLGLQLWGGGGARKMKLSTPPTPAAAQAETAHTWDPPPPLPGLSTYALAWAGFYNSIF